MNRDSMHIPFVDLHIQYLNLKKRIDGAIQSVIHDSAFIRGKYVEEFEKMFARKLGIKNCIGVANGTDALYIALRCLGIGPGDEVITTACSWISTSETISQCGANPIFVDVEPDYFSMNPQEIEDKITPRTKAILPVHLYGQPADIHPIQKLCKKHSLFLIEDCAQAHFATYDGKNTGTFGLAATFSFYPGKNLGAYGDAGAILTNDDSLANQMRSFANHGSLKKHDHQMEGINSRLDGLQAAILSVKLPFIDEWNLKRCQNAKRYNELLSMIKQVQAPLIRSNSTHIFHLYVVKTDRRDELKRFLEGKGIEVAIHYPQALPFLKAYARMNHKPEDFPVAFANQNRILSLPMYPELTNEQIYYVTEAIREFFCG